MRSTPFAYRPRAPSAATPSIVAGRWQGWREQAGRTDPMVQTDKTCCLIGVFSATEGSASRNVGGAVQDSGMNSYDGEPLKVLGLDPHDPVSVLAWRKFLLDWDADLAVMAAAVAADQVRVRAKLAEMASVLDELDGTEEHAMHVQSLAAEIALIEQIGQAAAEGALSDAGIAVREFPGFVDALGEGKLNEEQLRVLTGAGLSVSHADAAEQSARRGEFVRVMLAELDSRVLPPKALRMAAARVAESLTEESVSERHERARKTRYVSVTATENGMCMLRARLPLIEGKAIADRLRKQGKALIRARPKPDQARRAPEASDAPDAQEASGVPDSSDGPNVSDAPDERTMDEVKADLFTDMLLTADPMSCAAAAGIQANVQFTIPILTALTKLGGNGAVSGTGSGPGSGRGPGPGPRVRGGGAASCVAGAARLTPAPALLDGMIPVPFEEAIRLAGTATSFVRILTHPITGTVTAVDTYRPSAAMRAFLAARDIHCRWPGCRQPATRCDLDHTHAWEHGGKTTLENLCGFCKHHHVMKHATAWTATQLDGGVMQLRTPSGKILTDRPEHHDVYFTRNDEYETPAAPPQDSVAETERTRAPEPNDVPGDPPPF
ncbi:DUF222 domain-containing protein [Pseudoclavibacter sp. JSM 162008]|uniref:HNH endonuclease signature motif containing protein n=1 Tax=Pseudoclavibacter sp. JSM 162008 TaxID=3229855 RepID=UPI00352551A9